jgi:hypothetical protein
VKKTCYEEEEGNLRCLRTARVERFQLFEIVRNDALKYEIDRATVYPDRNCGCCTNYTRMAFPKNSFGGWPQSDFSCCEKGLSVHRIRPPCCSVESLYFFPPLERERTPCLFGTDQYQFMFREDIQRQTKKDVFARDKIGLKFHWAGNTSTGVDVSLSAIIRGLMIFQLGDIVLEYVGRRLAFTLLSALWKNICDVHGDNIGYALSCKIKEEIPRLPPQIRYVRPVLRTALMTYELSQWIFVHMENVKLAVRAVVLYRDTKTDACRIISYESRDGLNPVSPCDGPMKLSRGTWNSFFQRAKHVSRHDEYADAWMFVFLSITNMYKLLQDMIPLLNPPCAMRIENASKKVRESVIVRMARSQILEVRGFKVYQMELDETDPLSVRRFLELPAIASYIDPGEPFHCSDCKVETEEYKEMSRRFHSWHDEEGRCDPQPNSEDELWTEAIQRAREAEEPNDEDMQTLHELKYAQEEELAQQAADQEPPAPNNSDTETDPYDTENDQDPGEVLAQSPTIDVIDLTGEEAYSQFAYRMGTL